jgi:hypothetical protein
MDSKSCAREHNLCHAELIVTVPTRTRLSGKQRNGRATTNDAMIIVKGYLVLRWYSLIDDLVARQAAFFIFDTSSCASGFL